MGCTSKLKWPAEAPGPIKAVKVPWAELQKAENLRDARKVSTCVRM